MAMLTGPRIIEEVQNGRILIDPFVPENVGPNSVDLRLGSSLAYYTDAILDPRERNSWALKRITERGLVLDPGNLYLGHTIEKAGSDHYVPLLEGRSSLGRLGVQVHMTAGFGDVGFKRQWTLEITVQHPVRLYAGMRICQVCFHEVSGPIKLYAGKYQRQAGPTASLAHWDKNPEK